MSSSSGFSPHGVRGPAYLSLMTLREVENKFRKVDQLLLVERCGCCGKRGRFFVPVRIAVLPHRGEAA